MRVKPTTHPIGCPTYHGPMDGINDDRFLERASEARPQCPRSVSGDSGAFWATFGPREAAQGSDFDVPFLGGQNFESDADRCVRRISSGCRFSPSFRSGGALSSEKRTFESRTSKSHGIRCELRKVRVRPAGTATGFSRERPEPPDGVEIHGNRRDFRERGPGSGAAETATGSPKKRRRLDLDASEALRSSPGRFWRVRRRMTSPRTPASTLRFSAAERANREPAGAFEGPVKAPVLSKVSSPHARLRDGDERRSPDALNPMARDGRASGRDRRAPSPEQTRLAKTHRSAPRSGSRSPRNRPLKVGDRTASRGPTALRTACRTPETCSERRRRSEDALSASVSDFRSDPDSGVRVATSVTVSETLPRRPNSEKRRGLGRPFERVVRRRVRGPGRRESGHQIWRIGRRIVAPVELKTAVRRLESFGRHEPRLLTLFR